MANTKRNIYIDVMKGLLITLVVIGHLPYFEYDSRTLTLIYSFHMHAFLIIGGILCHINENTKLSNIILKRIKKTLLPYFVFYIISILFIPSTTEQKINCVIVMFKGIGDPVHALNLPLWFLTFYFVAMTTYEIILWVSYKIFSKLFSKKNYKDIIVYLITLVFISILMYISYRYARYYKYPRVPFNVEIAWFCLLFVYIGNVAAKIIPDIFNTAKKNIFIVILSIIVLIICIAIWYTLSMRNGRIDLNARDYKNALYMYIDAILGFIIFATLSYPISKIPIINFIFKLFGENSIYILAYHVPSVFISNAFIIPYLPLPIGIMLLQNSIPSIMILTSFGILFSLIMAFIHKCIHFPA